MGGEIARLRPRLVIATFRQWTMRELDLRREAASASELAEGMVGRARLRRPRDRLEPHRPPGDDARMDRRHQAVEPRRADRRRPRSAGARRTAGPRLPAPGDRRGLLPRRHAPGQSVRAGRRRARRDRFRHHGPDRSARAAVARRDPLRPDHRQLPPRRRDPFRGAAMCPPHHNLAEFTTALRAVGEPIRGLPVKDISIGQMLDGLFGITRDFDMPTQPHLLLLQKTMVMVEGVATALDPDINMWETAGPVRARMAALRAWPRGGDRRPPDRPISARWPACPISSAGSRRASRAEAPPRRRRRCARCRWCGSAAAGAMRWWRSPPRWRARRAMWLVG